MSAPVTAPNVKTDAWELAERVLNRSKGVKEILTFIFNESIKLLEELAKTKFPTEIKNKVWEKGAPQRLQKLEELFITHFSQKVLGAFKESEIAEMLQEHKNKSFFSNLIFGQRIEKFYTSHQEELQKTLTENATAILYDWMPEMMETIRNEGVQLPEIEE